MRNDERTEPDSLADGTPRVETTVDSKLALLAAIEALGADAEWLRAGLVTLIRSLPRVTPSTLGGAERASLIASGSISEAALAAAEDDVARGAAALGPIETWVKGAWETRSVRSVATFLHIEPRDVWTLIKDARLIGVEIGGEMRIPSWQFSTRPVGRTLPHLEELIPALLRRWDPLQIGFFFETRQENLYGQGRKTPAAWLEDGGNSEAIAKIVGR